MRRALTAALVLACVPAGAAAAFRSAGRVTSCQGQRELRSPLAFDVTVSSFPTIVDRRLNIREVNRLRPVKPPPKTIAHGLSMADYRLRYTTREEAAEDRPGGRVCAWIVSVTVDLTPDDIRIYIPKDYAPKSCESKALLLHEMEHERLHRRRLDEAAAKMRKALIDDKDLPGPGTPIGAAAPEDAYVRLKSRVDSIVRPIYNSFVREIAAEQQTLDNPAEYRRLGDACPDWKVL